MPWTYKSYPTSMKHLKPSERSRAIGIANALLDKGYSDEQAIVFAQAHLKRIHSPLEVDKSQRSVAARGRNPRPSRRTTVKSAAAKSSRPARQRTTHKKKIVHARHL